MKYRFGGFFYSVKGAQMVSTWGTSCWWPHLWPSLGLKIMKAKGNIFWIVLYAELATNFTLIQQQNECFKITFQFFNLFQINSISCFHNRLNLSSSKKWTNKWISWRMYLNSCTKYSVTQVLFYLKNILNDSLAFHLDFSFFSFQFVN